MKILFIGDISGPDGIRAVKENLNKIKVNESIDFVIANGENTTNGRGLNLQDYELLCSYGINFFTMGNHTWFHSDNPIVLDKDNIVRPANLDQNEMISKYGHGFKRIMINNKWFTIINLLGNSVTTKFNKTNPFLWLNKFLNENKNDDYIIVDFHAETTSEKNAFFLEFKNRVHAILGTHTHVQTADSKLVDNTLYITDVGMTGNSLGVIGASPKTIIEMFKEERQFFKLEPNIGKYQFSAVILELNENKNKNISIKRILITEN